VLVASGGKGLARNAIIIGKEKRNVACGLMSGMRLLCSNNCNKGSYSILYIVTNEFNHLLILKFYYHCPITKHLNTSSNFTG